MYKRLARSLAITLTISTLVGLLFYFTNNTFWLPAGLTTVIQIAVWLVIIYVADILLKIKMEQIENERVGILSKMGVDVECSFCGEEAFAPIDLSIPDNVYTCDKCKKDNLIMITVKTAQTTQPVTMSDAQVISAQIGPVSKAEE